MRGCDIRSAVTVGIITISCEFRGVQSGHPPRGCRARGAVRAAVVFGILFEVQGDDAVLGGDPQAGVVAEPEGAIK